MDGYHPRKAASRSRSTTLVTIRWVHQADFIIDQDLDFILGNVVKRVPCRSPGDSLDDLKKAQAYITKAIESTNDLEHQKEARTFHTLMSQPCDLFSREVAAMQSTLISEEQRIPRGSL